uniref:Ankyrin repeat and SOCS box containing 15 n=1 Tax=Tetraodon nigroviridis TaxID=99883 RepID=H3CYI2_TETNG
MYEDEEEGEEQLSDRVIQLSLHESCQESFLSLAAGTDENLRVAAAVEQGEVLLLSQLLQQSGAFQQRDGRGWLPLHRAAVQPVPEVLRTVLRSATQRRSLEERTAAGESALTLALKAGRAHNVSALLEAGASPHAANGSNETPLAAAVKAGSYEMTHALISCGAWAEQVCWRKWTATHEAARLGRADILMLLLRNGGRVNHKDLTGVTPLAVAAEHGHAHIAELLLSCGGRVNAQACNGDSVLLDAAGSGSTACIRLLLDHGADANLASATGHLPIHKAYAGHHQALKMLMPLTSRRAIKAAGQSPVHSGAEGGRARCLELLLAGGFDVNYRMEARKAENYRDLRRTALYFAVSNGDAECTRILLAAGARTDLDPLSCLLVAVRSGRYDLVELLLASRADVNRCFTAVSDTLFPTALQYCLKDEAMMRLLLNNGYDADKCFQCHHGDAAATGKIPVSLGRAAAPPVGAESQRRCSSLQFCEFIGLCCVLHLSGKVVRILLDYTGHVRICPRLHSILEKQAQWPEIRQVLVLAPVGHLCRLQMRRSLTLRRLNNPKVMNSHIIPPRLKRFLLYQELELSSSTGP